MNKNYFLESSDNFSFVEVPAGYVDEVMRNVNGKEIKGKVVNIEIAKN